MPKEEKKITKKVNKTTKSKKKITKKASIEKEVKNESKSVETKTEELQKPSGSVEGMTSTHATGKLLGEFMNLNTKLILVAVVGIALLLFFTLKMSGVGFFDGSNDVLLTVNGIEITEAQVQEELTNLPSYYLTAGIDDQTIRTAIIDQLIAKELIESQAAALGVVVSEEEIEETITQIMEQNGLSEEEFTKSFEEQGLTEQSLRDLIAEQIAINKVVEQEVLTNIQITEEEINTYYEESKEILVEVEASHILICYEGSLNCERTRTKEEAHDLTAELIEKVKTGSDFAELALAYSDDPSAEFNSGYLGWFKKGQMVPPFEAAAFGLNAGEMATAPVETDFGYHVIYVTDTKTSLNDVYNDILQSLTLERQQAALQEYIDMLSARANIEWE
jgi:parvulin-like peptidyl-prolyl isomerase